VAWRQAKRRRPNNARYTHTHYSTSPSPFSAQKNTINSRRFCKPKNPALLRLLLGGRISVVTMRKDEAVGIREEYHAFRNRAMLIMAAVPLTLYSGMRRADSVRDKHHAGSITLTPQLLTGAVGGMVGRVWGGGERGGGFARPNTT
jgi:hypothetical protein